MLVPGEHRPWPRPRRPWLLAMQWHDLLFAHWPVHPRRLQPLIPPGLELQTFDGHAWIAVVPFRMAGTRPRGTPALPVVGAFPELNVRTYVTAGGKPGVWFFSLDAASPPAVEAARLLFHLPYIHALMACIPDGAGVRYASRRHPGDPRPAALRARYRPAGPVYTAAPGTLEHWLTERYCLYAANRRGQLWRGEIDHAPWPLQPAEAELPHNSMTAPLGLALQGPPLLHFARRLDVVAWGLDPVSR
jgi:uncharacterized protein YqjF (DUF2071 family)